MFGHPGVVWFSPSSLPPSFTHHIHFGGMEGGELCSLPLSLGEEIEDINVSSISLSHSLLGGGEGKGEGEGDGGLPGWLKKTTPVCLHLSHCSLKNFEEGGKGKGGEVLGKMRCVEYLDLSWNLGLKLSSFPQFLTVLILSGSLQVFFSLSFFSCFVLTFLF